jgi:hypothetical protein
MYVLHHPTYNGGGGLCCSCGPCTRLRPHYGTILLQFAREFMKLSTTRLRWRHRLREKKCMLKGTMLPAHTRPEARLVQPTPSPNRRQQGRVPTEEPEEAGSDVADGDTEAGAKMSVGANVREYERARAELSHLNVRCRQLRERSGQLRQSIEAFMRSRNLQCISTRCGDIAIKFVERSNRVRPSRRDTEKCIRDALGVERSDLAGRLINELFEAKKQKRRITKAFTPT